MTVDAHVTWRCCGQIGGGVGKIRMHSSVSPAWHLLYDKRLPKKESKRCRMVCAVTNKDSQDFQLSESAAPENEMSH